MASFKSRDALFRTRASVPGILQRLGAVSVLLLVFGTIIICALLLQRPCGARSWASPEEEKTLWVKTQAPQVRRPDVLVIGSFFSAKNDPQRGRSFKNCQDYLRPWYDSIHAHGMQGVLLHDGLSESFMNNLTTESFKFVWVNTSSMHQALWPAEWRMFALYDYLRGRPELDYIIATDVSDVSFNAHVGDFMMKFPQANLFLASEGRPDMGWMSGTWHRCFQETYPPVQQKVYAAGLFGGKRDALVTHLYVAKSLLLKLAENNPGAAGVCDMVAHNKAIYDFWKMDQKGEKYIWEDGQPLYNKIKTEKGEPGEEDDILKTYYVVHRHRHINCT